MKNLKDLAYMSAVLLTGSLGFIACSSSDDVAEDLNPTYDGKSVKTQIALNINPNTSTRMVADATQQDGASFKGITDIHLLTLNTDPANAATTTDVTIVDLESNEISSTQSSKEYQNVQIEVGTNNMLFYGRTAASGIDEEKGVLEYDFTDTKNKNVKINLKTRWNSGNYADGTTSAELASALTKIAGATGWSSSTDTDMQDAYKEFTATYAGSGKAILNLVQRLYTFAKGSTLTEAQNIVTAITTTAGIFSVDASGTVSYTDSKYLDFPTDLNVPEGSPVLSYSTSGFSYQYSAAGTTANENLVGLSMANIRYPAELMYFVNTPIRVSSSTVPTTYSWPTTTDAWTTETNWVNRTENVEWDSSDGAAVTASTKMIALKNNINYGVALLASTFKCGQSPLTDNVAMKKKLEKNDNATETSVTVPSAGFPITGIIVGEQPASVNWQLVGTANKAEDRLDVVYDSKVQDKDGNTIYAKTGGASEANYTLLLDNWASQSIQGSVNVALEVENTSSTGFYGVDGYIAVGQKFYLVGTLSLVEAQKTTDETKKINWPANTYYNIANYGVDRVFIQDFKTKANFTITSLKNAYVTVPDLRSTKVVLGLSVDLSWSTGYTFDVELD